MSDPRLDLLDAAGIEERDAADALATIDRLLGTETKRVNDGLAAAFGHDTVRATHVLLAGGPYADEGVPRTGMPDPRP